METKEPHLSNTGKASIVELITHLKAKNPLPQLVRLKIEENYDPYLRMHHYVDDPEIKAERLRAEHTYLTAHVIEPFLTSNQDLYPMFADEIQADRAHTGPSLKDVLVLTQNIMHASMGPHDDDHNKKRGDITKDICYPEKSEGTNCLSFNDIYIRVFNAVCANYCPELLEKHALVRTSANFAPDVTKIFFANPHYENAYFWTLKHSHLTLISAGEDSDSLMCSIIDPYHTDVIDINEDGESGISRLDYTNKRGMDGYIQTRFLQIAATQNLENTNLLKKRIEFYKLIGSEFDVPALVQSENTTDQILGYHLSHVLMCHYIENLRRLPQVGRALRTMAASSSYLLEQFDKGLKQKTKVYLDAVESGSAFATKIQADDTVNYAQRQVELSIKHHAKFLQNTDDLVKLLEEYTVLGQNAALISRTNLNRLEQNATKSVSLSPELVISAFDFEMFTASAGFMLEGATERLENVLKAIERDPATHSKAVMWMNITLKHGEYYIPEDLDPKDFIAWKNLYKQFVRSAQKGEAPLSQVKFIKNKANAQFDELEQELQSELGVKAIRV